MCFIGTPIMINIITTITVNANSRYDVGVFLGINGNIDPLGNQTRTACRVQTLGPDDDARNPTVSQIDVDKCWDYQADGANKTIVGFVIKDYNYTCTAGGADNKTAIVAACFSWDNNAGDNCPSECKNGPNLPYHTQCLIPGTTAVSSAPPPPSLIGLNDLFITHITFLPPPILKSEMFMQSN